MTKLTFFVSDKHLVGFSCKGHSGYSNEGYDIVCAAISTAVELTASYLVKYHSDKTELVVNEKNAEIRLRCADWFIESERQFSVLEDFAKDLKDQYSEYFTFDYLEV